MGAAPKTLEDPRLAPEPLSGAEREWFLDTEAGELKPEEDPGEDRRVRPRAIRVARQIFD